MKDNFLIEEVEKIEVDPHVKNLTRRKLMKEIKELEKLLDEEVDEQKIQDFLAHHTYFFNGIIRLFGTAPMYSRVKLGSQYEVDFACCDTSSNGPDWRIIEIEGPKYPLFNNSGEPSARLNHALQQVKDWQHWIHENLDYARKLMPYICYPMGYVFIGRRKSLNEQTMMRFRRINYENRMNVEIHTLDWFVSAAYSVENLLSRDSGGWPLPPIALTHKDLNDGMPKDVLEYMHRYTSDSMFRKYPEEILSQRKQQREEDFNIS